MLLWEIDGLSALLKPVTVVVQKTREVLGTLPWEEEGEFRFVGGTVVGSSPDASSERTEQQLGN